MLMTPDTKQLQTKYTQIRRTTDSLLLNDFVSTLMASHDPTVVALHYECLRDSRKSNPVLHQLLKAEFSRRDAHAVAFLTEQEEYEADVDMRVDILTLLSVMDSKSALRFARQAVHHADAKIRAGGCAVLGDQGAGRDITLLNECLLQDTAPSVRMAAAAAHTPFLAHSPRHRRALLRSLYGAVLQERDDVVMSWVVIIVQTILAKDFGLYRKDGETTVQGNLTVAYARCLKAMQQLNLD